WLFFGAAVRPSPAWMPEGRILGLALGAGLRFNTASLPGRVRRGRTIKPAAKASSNWEEA
ncbi:MAG: hypothetical protein V3V34_02360, partial [Kiloniellales bacterium]